MAHDSSAKAISFQPFASAAWCFGKGPAWIWLIMQKDWIRLVNKLLTLSPDQHGQA